jgi:hypothetical protein
MAKLRKRDTAIFTNPETGEKMECSIEDQVWPVEPGSFPRYARKGYGWKQPAFVAQLLNWDGEKRVRITYWVRDAGGGPNDWRFGGQFSPMMTLREYRALMKKLNQKNW